MGQSLCHDDDCCEERFAIRKTLLKNTGKVVIVFTRTGGCAGEGFTGLIATVCDDTLRLITSIPSAPPYPFEGRCCKKRCCDDFELCRNRCCSHFGSAVIIPLCEITSVVVAEV